MDAEHEKHHITEHLPELVAIGGVASLLGAIGVLAYRRLNSSDDTPPNETEPPATDT